MTGYKRNDRQADMLINTHGDNSVTVETGPKILRALSRSAL